MTATRARGNQTSFEDLREGARLRDAGMAAADDAVEPEWKDLADRGIEQLAASGREFTAVDVRAIAGDPPGHPNAFGMRLRLAADHGLIRKLGMVPSQRPSLHAHPISLWIGSGLPPK